jgi:Cu+-exporting ATPase
MREYGQRLVQALALGVPAFVLTMTSLLDFLPLVARQAGAFVLTALLLLFPARVFFVVAWRSLKHGSAEMNTLIALSTGTAFVHGLFVFGLTQMGVEGLGHFYLDAVAMISVLVLFGRWLEARARLAAVRGVAELSEHMPKMVRTIQGKTEVEVPIEELRAGVEFLVRPGERVPLDGEVIDGESECDESLVTGESKPVAKEPGSQVAGGSVNGLGPLRVRASEDAEGSTLGRIPRTRQAGAARACAGAGSCGSDRGGLRAGRDCDRAAQWGGVVRWDRDGGSGADPSALGARDRLPLRAWTRDADGAGGGGFARRQTRGAAQGQRGHRAGAAGRYGVL